MMTHSCLETKSGHPLVNDSPVLHPPRRGVADRALGAFLGLAVGDALGTTLEFTRRDSRPHHAEITGDGPFRLPAGAWTDDTAMAVALARSLLSRGRFDARDVMDGFLAWWRHGEHSCTGTCFDIGNTTARSLARFEATGEVLAGSTDAGEAGNGALMRLAPVAVATFDDAAEAHRLAALSSRLTHGAPQSVDACTFFAQILHEAFARGDPLAPRALDAHPEVAAVAAGGWRGKERDEISSSGYVVHTLEAALWCVGRTKTFEDAVVLAVNLGHDADTVGAVTGQLAGAIHGASSIPQRWLATLAWRDELVRLGDGLFSASPAAAVGRG